MVKLTWKKITGEQNKTHVHFGILCTVTVLTGEKLTCFKNFKKLKKVEKNCTQKW